MPLSDLEFLKAVKAKISTPETWTSGSMARNKHGDAIKPNSPDAVRWCVLGAAGVVETEGARRIIIETAFVRKGTQISYINDAKGFDAVHAILDRAIKAFSA